MPVPSRASKTRRDTRLSPFSVAKSWHQAVDLTGTATPALTIYPNPTADQTTVQWEAAAAGAGHWQLASTTGQAVGQGSFAVQPGRNLHAIDLRHLPAGSYVLTVEANGQALRRQLVQKAQ